MKIICVALNYYSHIQEMGGSDSSSKEAPILFLKPDTALLTDDKHRFFIPDFSSNIHYETELVVKIDKVGKNIAERFAHRYYSEITIGIDFTARDLQTELRSKGLPWEISKGFDNSAVVGRFISKERIGKEINNIEFALMQNENLVQSANTSQLIHSVDQIIAYTSQFYTLKTGDLIFTGTPTGVGKVNIGDKLKGMLEGEELLELHVC